MEGLIYLTTGGSVFLLIWAIYDTLRETSEYTDLPGEEKVPLHLRILLPYARMIGISIASSLGRREIDENKGISFIVSFKKRIDRAIIAAGTPYGLNAYHFIGMMFISSIIAMCLIFLFTIFIGWSLNVVFSLTILFGMFFFVRPILWLRDKVNRRGLSIKRHLPFSLDLLTLTVEAGMDFTSALAVIVKKLGATPLAKEFNQALREISMGKTRPQALRDMTERVDIPEMHSVTGAIIQADELGASLGPVLRILSDQIRTKRFQRAEKLALEAPVKMLFPLVCFIFPTTFIMIFGPIVLNFFLKG